MANHRLTIVVSGMIAGDPRQGGATWAVLQYLLGLRRLGHNVLFVEPLDEKSLRPAGVALADTDNAAYFHAVMEQFGFGASAALLLAGTQETVGLSFTQMRRLTEQADVLINISGMLTDKALIEAIGVRVYLDLDPGFIQLWHAAQGIDMRFNGHTHFVTIGQAIGQPDCPVPTCGRSWLPTLQPLVLPYWPVAAGPLRHGFTTVGNWRGYGSIEHEGVFYGQKAHSLRPLMNLPMRTKERFRLALAIDRGETKDLAALAANGWELVEPAHVAGTPDDYQQFIQFSKGEFGIAKSGYVASRCGWFSDRSICYLASGRPVLAQDTGFPRFVPTGIGLFSFSDIDGALHALETVNQNYTLHANAARVIAEDYFDSDKVLTRLLQRLGVAP
jgi:hypothetical protein